MTESGNSTSPPNLPDLDTEAFDTSKSMEALVADLKSAHDRANAICAHVQAFREEAGTPAINEMRSAGYHLVKGIDDGGALADKDQVLRAIRHFERASYEAAEAGILYALEEIGRFKKRFETVSINAVIPSWTECLKACNDAQKHVGAKRDKHEDEHAHKARFDMLVDIVETCEAANDELNKLIEKQRAQILNDRRDTRRFIIQVILGVLAIAATFVAAHFVTA